MHWKTMRIRRALTGRCLLLAMAFGPTSGSPASAGEPFPRAGNLPANAIVRPGIDTEGYPHIDGAQKWAIGKEIAGSSLKALIENPFCATTQVVGRAGERLAVRARELTLPVGSARAGIDRGAAGDGCLDSPVGSPLQGACLTLLPTSEECVQGLLELIQAATMRVDLMIYGWEDDPTGREVAAYLEAAARRGVRVRLIVDRGGFVMHNRASAVGEATFLDRLKTVPNVSVIEPGNAFVRFDHRKLAVIDGQTAWSGGMILTEVSRRRWRNLGFIARGPVAGQLAAIFEDRWREVGGTPRTPLFPNPPTPSPLPNATVRVVRTDLRDRSLKAAIFHAIDHARSHIYLENPYFSDEILAGKLVEARRRGVDVRVVLTLRGNIRKLNRYVVLTANRLLRGGVRVYLDPGMTHVKAMSVDGLWSYVGTGNFDELSLRNNREVGLAVLGPEFAQALDRSIFLPDIALAEELKGPLPLPEHWVWLELFALWY